MIIQMANAGEVLMRGILLAYFLYHGLPEEKRSGRKKAYIMLQTYLVISFVLFLINAAMGVIPVMNSRHSMIKFCVFAVMVSVAAAAVYRGKRGAAVSLVGQYFAIQEIVRFILYSIWISVLQYILQAEEEWIMNLGAEELESYLNRIQIIDWFWNYSFSLAILCMSFLLYRLFLSLLPAEVFEKSGAVQLIFLIPAFLSLFFVNLLRYMVLVQSEGQVDSIFRIWPETNFLTFGAGVLCLATILASPQIMRIYRNLQEEEQRNLFYRQQMDEMKTHVGQLEELYSGIRGVRHDMKNYVYEIEMLLKKSGEAAELNSNQGIEYRVELQSYLDELYRSLDTFENTYQSGNPVTDIIISQKMKEAWRRGISFSCDFLYPKDYGISAFDLSIILNNGLDNAMEACGYKDSYIDLHSYVKNSMIMIEIKNSYHGKLKWNTKSGLPETSKADQERHGAGLYNIKKCVEKYYGKMDMIEKNREVILRIMMQGKKSVHDE